MTTDQAVSTKLETNLRPGQIVAGKYCVDHLIGEGGMAAVWAGTNLRTGKRVALKVILRSFASTPGAEEMFRREALAASRVNHPNVVNVFDVIEHDSMACIVMELLDGEHLGTYLACKGVLGVEEAVWLLLPAMRGVAAANAQGVVHRDLKPQNIFICVGPDGRPVTTKILDFGISVVSEKTAAKGATTILVTTHGTPAYMSPEHITGATDIDERVDVYGFGVIFFEALTGKLPFLGESGPELLVRILNEPPPKVSLYRPDLSPAVVAIVERAMAKDPEDRFPDLNDFVRALEEHGLPRSPLPRSLTPMIGVSLFDTGSGPSGVADPVVQMIHRSEPSGEHGTNETKALYGLPSSNEMKHRTTVRRPRAGDQTVEAQSPSTVVVDMDSSEPGAPKRRMPRRLLSAASFVGAVAVVAWVALPKFPRDRGYPQDARESAVPTVPLRSQPNLSVPPVSGPTMPERAAPMPTELAPTVPVAEAPSKPEPVALPPESLLPAAFAPGAVRTLRMAGSNQPSSVRQPEPRVVLKRAASRAVAKRARREGATGPAPAELAADGQPAAEPLLAVSFPDASKLAARTAESHAASASAEPERAVRSDKRAPSAASPERASRAGDLSLDDF